MDVNTICCEMCSGNHPTVYHLPEAIKELQRRPSRIPAPNIGWKKSEGSRPSKP